ncbi:hypothetical protein MSG28_015580 [Choristoneura fumiferana]|uniref:Uncharacterized protein n=1 Tax=Choristoneura fumiferana TaxID=7141 RepID=A0ACC0KB25_CHOFU|nr:hypothetical protein MSG28_015580 [Choristoneura fumiferana]
MRSTLLEHALPPDVLVACDQSKPRESNGMDPTARDRPNGGGRTRGRLRGGGEEPTGRKLSCNVVSAHASARLQRMDENARVNRRTGGAAARRVGGRPAGTPPPRAFARAAQELQALYQPRLLVDTSLQAEQQKQREHERALQREEARREAREKAARERERYLRAAASRQLPTEAEPIDSDDSGGGADAALAGSPAGSSTPPLERRRPAPRTQAPPPPGPAHAAERHSPGRRAPYTTFAKTRSPLKNSFTPTVVGSSTDMTSPLPLQLANSLSYSSDGGTTPPRPPRPPSGAEHAHAHNHTHTRRHSGAGGASEGSSPITISFKAGRDAHSPNADAGGGMRRVHAAFAGDDDEPPPPAPLPPPQQQQPAQHHHRGKEKKDKEKSKKGDKEKEKDKDKDKDRAEAGEDKASAEEKRRHIKSLIDKIPTQKDQLFQYKLDTAQIDSVLMEKKIRPWINKKIIEYIGEPEPTLVDFICSKVVAGAAPARILDDVQMVLDEEAEVFVVKMWRLLIYELEAKRAGLHK